MFLRDRYGNSGSLGLGCDRSDGGGWVGAQFLGIVRSGKACSGDI